MNGNEVWLMYQVKSETRFSDDSRTARYEVGGVFENEQDAVNACVDSWDCVCPMTIGEVLPRDAVIDPRAYYPLNSDF